MKIVTNLTYFGFIVALAVPFQWVDYWRLAGIPGLNAAYALLMVAILIYGWKSLVQAELFAVLGVLALMAVHGLYNKDEAFWSYKFFFTDLAYASAIVAGYLFVKLRGVGATIKVFASTYIIALVLLLGIGILIRAGILGTSGDGGRSFDPSQYSMHYVLLAMMPFALFQWGSRRMFYILLAAGSIVALDFAVTSGTRSAFITTLITGLTCLSVKIVHSPATRIAVAGVAASMLVAFSNLDLSKPLSALGLLGERFQTERVSNDSRITELEAMMDQLQGGYLQGRGLGAGFLSPVIVVSEQEDRGIAPHIGILTWLYKGGILAQGLFIWLLFVIGIRTRGLGPIGAWLLIALLHYTLVASISGGYGYAPLFVVGSCWAVTSTPMDRRETDARNYKIKIHSSRLRRGRLNFA